MPAGRSALAEQLAGFVVDAKYEWLSEAARRELIVRVLDGLGCAIGALGTPVAEAIREQTAQFGGAPLCTLFGGGRSAPDRAAFYNSALVRYLDFNDSYLARKETCHPSDNLAAVLAACEYAAGREPAGATGRDFLTALAVAYQVQCRLSDAAPVRDKGFDHTTQGAYAVAAGVAKALKLNREQTANALGMCGAAFNALRVTRTGALSNWKGLAYPNTAFCAAHATFLALRGITGPVEVFEGNKGFMDAIAGKFELDWAREDLERVTRTIVKRYNAEIHSQSAIEGVLELRERHGLSAAAIDRIEIEIFDVAFRIIGGGEEGDKSVVHTKEQADHSLPYLIAAALLDGEVMPRQYTPERIARPDVQGLLRRVRITPARDLSERFPQEMACRIRIRVRGGEEFFIEKRDYEGFVTRPMSWQQAAGKFELLSEPHTSSSLRRAIVETVAGLDTKPIRELTDLMAGVASRSPKESVKYGGT